MEALVFLLILDSESQLGLPPSIFNPSTEDFQNNDACYVHSRAAAFAAPSVPDSSQRKSLLASFGLIRSPCLGSFTRSDDRSAKSLPFVNVFLGVGTMGNCQPDTVFHKPSFQ